MLRVLWMLLFLLIWQLCQLIVGAVVVLQLLNRILYGQANTNLAIFAAELGQYLAQIVRFGCFSSDSKPWPFAAWPKAEGKSL